MADRPAGTGGHGGSVYLVGDERLNTLFHLRFRSIYIAERGRHGEGSQKTGRTGEDLLIPVPLGSVVRDAESGAVRGEVLEDGERLRVAAGGRGGRGNARFKSATSQVPRRADPGEEGEEFRLELELKLLADVGVVGLPNAGKSTLISSISAARPKIADYPFTTLVPQLGVVAEDRVTEPFVIADLPGLIRGAADGAGLGHQFLRHVERCRTLLHLVDLSAEGDAAAELEVLERELEAFDSSLLTRPRIIVGSKADAAIESRQDELSAAAEKRGARYLEISSVTRQGLPELIREIRRQFSRESAS